MFLNIELVNIIFIIDRDFVLFLHLSRINFDISHNIFMAHAFPIT